MSIISSTAAAAVLPRASELMVEGLLVAV